jgi:hypothetical protein
MRIGSMIKLLQEVRNAPLDDGTGAAGGHSRTLDRRTEEGSGAELVSELGAITLPWREGTPSDGLRIAQAQLVGWLEGLFHGIQTVLFAQMAAAPAGADAPGASAGHQPTRRPTGAARCRSDVSRAPASTCDHRVIAV